MADIDTIHDLDIFPCWPVMVSKELPLQQLVAHCWGSHAFWKTLKITNEFSRTWKCS